jgi:hypothetical protein
LGQITAVLGLHAVVPWPALSTVDVLALGTPANDTLATTSVKIRTPITTRNLIFSTSDLLT